MKLIFEKSTNAKMSNVNQKCLVKIVTADVLILSKLKMDIQL